MPKRVRFDGKEHVFPDDFTDADIASALRTVPSRDVAHSETAATARGLAGGSEAKIGPAPASQRLATALGLGDLAASALESSGAGRVVDFIAGIPKGIESTSVGAQHLAQLAMGLPRGLYAPPPAPETVGPYEAAGKMAEQGAEFMLPGAALGRIPKAAAGATRVAKLANLVTRSLATGAEFAGVGAVQRGTPEHLATDAAIGALFPPGEALAGLAIRGAKPAASAVARGVKAVSEKALSSPEAALDLASAVLSATTHVPIPLGRIFRTLKYGADAVKALRGPAKAEAEAAIAEARSAVEAFGSAPAAPEASAALEQAATRLKTAIPATGEVGSGGAKSFRVLVDGQEAGRIAGATPEAALKRARKAFGPGATIEKASTTPSALPAVAEAGTPAAVVAPEIGALTAEDVALERARQLRDQRANDVFAQFRDEETMDPSALRAEVERSMSGPVVEPQRAANLVELATAPSVTPRTIQQALEEMRLKKGPPFPGQTPEDAAIADAAVEAGRARLVEKDAIVRAHELEAIASKPGAHPRTIAAAESAAADARKATSLRELAMRQFEQPEEHVPGPRPFGAGRFRYVEPSGTNPPTVTPDPLTVQSPPVSAPPAVGGPLKYRVFSNGEQVGLAEGTTRRAAEQRARVQFGPDARVGYATGSTVDVPPSIPAPAPVPTTPPDSLEGLLQQSVAQAAAKRGVPGTAAATPEGRALQDVLAGAIEPGGVTRGGADAGARALGGIPAQSAGGLADAELTQVQAALDALPTVSGQRSAAKDAMREAREVLIETKVNLADAAERGLDPESIGAMAKAGLERSRAVLGESAPPVLRDVAVLPVAAPPSAPTLAELATRPPLVTAEATAPVPTTPPRTLAETALGGPVSAVADDEASVAQALLAKNPDQPHRGVAKQLAEGGEPRAFTGGRGGARAPLKPRIETKTVAGEKRYRYVVDSPGRERALRGPWSASYDEAATAFDAHVRDRAGALGGVALGAPAQKAPAAEAATSAPEAVPLAQAAREVGDKEANFKRWFGESKARGSDNKPLRLYHGTSSKRFDTFRVSGDGAFFTEDPSIAAEYAGRKLATRDARVIPVYLKAENPLDLRRRTLHQEANALLDFLDEHGIARTRPEPKSGAGAFTYLDDDVWRAIQSEGYDSVRLTDSGTPLGGEQSYEVWAVKDPAQIKSANRNRGTFDPMDPRIGYGLAALALGGAAGKAKASER